MINRKNIIFFFSSIIGVIFIGFIVYISLPRTFINLSNPIYSEVCDEFVDSKQYALVVKIEDIEYTKSYDSTGTDIPYTFYSIKQIEFVKGQMLSDDSKVCFYGGRLFLNTYNYENINIELPEKDKYYFIIANIKEAGSTNKRIGNYDFILTQDIQKVKLEGYDENKSLYEQSDEILNIVEKYIYYINN